VDNRVELRRRLQREGVLAVPPRDAKGVIPMSHAELREALRGRESEMIEALEWVRGPRHGV
jgi:hypothetical protein